ncbi:outer membrane lipoprotein carrier protein [Campylobacter iguaniorum]|uniref:Outer membrane lipoprotein carrier protein n=1 Tax=Campylobacter iguaniorum TaxID=1244531 RepID=A0A076F9W4_9BACT|nr:LolA-like outer membrane lipoprotein chaperone [Campylobacter iguaniorum]AII14488.1 outer membrane lipoprotein carrier protein [Campylobacter iguaniorum]ALV24223.1 outer membrane lipoprotein carrier protein [Campylobacter iguaniorum]
MKKFLVVLCVLASWLVANELSFTTLSSNFTQTVQSQTKKITYSGYFVAKKDIGAFWHYKEPIKKLIYFNYGRVTILEPELEQAILTDLKNSPNLTDILSSAKKISNDKFEALYDDTKYIITVKNSLPARISYTDKLDNKVDISLSQTRKDEPINEGLLEPKIPEYYDILTN